MGSSKKSKDKDREHKKKKKHRSSRSKSRERRERREAAAARSRSRSPLERGRADSPSSLIRELKREQRIKEEVKSEYSPPPASSHTKREHSPHDDIKPPPRLKREERSPEERRGRSRRDDRSPESRRSRKEEKKPKSPEPAPGADGEAAGDNLSIEAANALRIKLGLKPLDLTPKPVDEEKESLKDDIHKPAVNISEVKRSQTLKEKLAAAKEKRLLNQKLGKVKGLADSDSDDDALNWVHKQKKKEKEKKRAAERAKLLDQMDEEFGISSLVEKEMKPNAPSYTSRDLKGLKVAHDQAKFSEGVTTILTLADKGVLDEGDDELMNVNIQDIERVEKNIENKKKKPTYNPYEVEEDEFGMMKAPDVLAKYDEEISGPKKGESFELGNRGSYNASQEKRMEEIRRELQSGAQNLILPAPTVPTEFYTASEMEAKFKKRKKKVRKVKRSETVKADDLLPLEDDANRTAMGGDETNMPVFSSEMANHLQRVVEEAPSDDEQNYVGGAQLDDEVNDDYQSSLALQRKLKQRKKMAPIDAAEKLLSTHGRQEAEESVTGNTFTDTPLEDDQVMLTATDEFCRNLGSIPTYGQSGNRNETRDELMDFEQELIAQSTKEQEEEEDKRGWERVEIQEEKPADLDNLGVFQDANVFEEEILLDGGIAAALRHATMKGFVETKSERHGGVTVKDTSTLLSKNYTIEDKKHDDIDEKFRKKARGERYQGPITDFNEKTYVPNFNLTYQDDQGRDLNEKEAFRVLSHKFHGKGSGKKKTEKRLKKLDEDLMLMTMSSTDTPLNTAARMKEKQLKEKSAYIVLSGGNKTLTGNSVVK